MPDRDGLRAAALLFAALVSAAAAPATWSQATVEDLEAAHAIIRDNHPGPVDGENPGFDRWLDGGEAALLPQARAARDAADERAVLLAYANGFADYHLAIRFAHPLPGWWPGFLTATALDGDNPGETRVAVATPGAGVATGDVLLGCDGVPVAAMLRDRVLRTLTNPAVPQRLVLTSPFLMVARGDDLSDRPARCRVATAGRIRIVALRWRRIDDAALARAVQEASGIVVPPLGIRRVGDVTLVSLPSFTWNGADARRMEALVAALRREAPALHAARHVVIDLRGNGGGSSEWGIEVAEALWGKELADAAEASIESTWVDWRVSPRNLATIRGDIASLRADGLAPAVAEMAGVAARMDRALRVDASDPGRIALVREPGDPAGPVPHAPSPFAHPVYVLTEPHCASACLDAVDLFARLPGAVRIGLPTGADTDYLELADATLPSGDATLAYATKVFRGRPRPANFAYRPRDPWPGGVMTDASIAAWVDTLP